MGSGRNARTSRGPILRFVLTPSDELNAWLGRESGNVATENTDVSAERKRGLSFVRSEKPERHKKKTICAGKEGIASAWADERAPRLFGHANSSVEQFCSDSGRAIRLR
jgi:hypothetical protein